MTSNPRILAELFTRAHLRKLAYNGWTQTLSASVDFLEEIGAVEREDPVSIVLDEAFRFLIDEYPIEYVYKSCFLRKMFLESDYHGRAALYMEYPVAEARADLLLINGSATVFEIKTRFDGAHRLSTQLEDYYRCFKEVTVLTDESRCDWFDAVLPSYVGLSVLTSEYSIDSKREPTETVDQLSHDYIYHRLHQKERYDLLSGLGLDFSKISLREVWSLGLKEFCTLPVETIQGYFVDALRSRKKVEQRSKRCRRFPECLQAGAFSYSIVDREWGKISGVLSEPLRPEPSPDPWPTDEEWERFMDSARRNTECPSL